MLTLAFLSVCMDSRLVLAFLGVFVDSSPCACVAQCLHVWTLVLTLAFRSACLYGLKDCADVSQCFCRLLSLRLRFSVSLWTLMLTLALLSVCMDSRLALRFSVSVWTLILTLALLGVCMDSRLALAFLSVCMDSYAYACIAWCLYGLKTCAAFLSACMDFCICACVSQCFYGLLCLRLRFLVFVRTQGLCMRFSVFVWSLVFALVFRSVCMDSFVWACVSQCSYG